MQVLPTTTQQVCWGLSQGCQLRRVPVDTAESIRAGTDAHRKDPDQRQAGYEVGFRLVLVPVINFSAKLLKGP